MPKLANSESPAEILQGMHLEMPPLINNVPFMNAHRPIVPFVNRT